MGSFPCCALQIQLDSVRPSVLRVGYWDGILSPFCSTRNSSRLAVEDFRLRSLGLCFHSKLWIDTGQHRGTEGDAATPISKGCPVVGFRSDFDHTCVLDPATR
jgi:hypothetical protein